MVHHNGTSWLVVAGRQAIIGNEAADDRVHLRTTEQYAGGSGYQARLSVKTAAVWKKLCVPSPLRLRDCSPHLALGKLKHVAQLRNAEGGVETAVRQEIRAQPFLLQLAAQHAQHCLLLRQDVMCGAEHKQ